MSDPFENVRQIYGGTVIEPGMEPNSKTIEVLRDMLQRAEAGEIVGFTGAMLHSDKSTSLREAGMATRALLGAVQLACYRLSKDLDES